MTANFFFKIFHLLSKYYKRFEKKDLLKDKTIINYYKNIGQVS